MTTLMAGTDYTAGAATLPAIATFKAASGTFAALGDPVRLRILWWLGAGERNVTELQRLLGQKQAAVSHHLTILKLREIVRVHRRGKSNFYSLTDGGREAMAVALPLIA